MAKTKYFIERTDPPIELTETDVLEYASQIGIDCKNEENLLWIAKEGLSAAVPEPWIILADENDRIYYYNRRTGQPSWSHPVDERFASLVREERAKSKSLNSTCSDLGFESKLSSLADAPPLSSGGKDKPFLPKQEKNRNDSFGGKKMDSGRFENRRGTQLTAVKLNTLKMPVPTAQPKPTGGVSFMPKGTSLTRNLRRPKEEPSPKRDRLSDVRGKNQVNPSFEANNSDNSDEGSKYSYEPVDVNHLVQLGNKLSNRLDIPKQLPKMDSSSNKDYFTPLTKRKMQDSYSLKPIQKGTNQKSTMKKAKNIKKAESKVYSDQTDVSSDILNYDEMEENVQEEWRKKLKRLEKEEEAKYEELMSKNFKKFEAEESKLRKENEDKIYQLQMELVEKFKEEEQIAERKLEELRKSNNEKLCQEEKRCKDLLVAQTQGLQQQIEKVENEIKKEVNERKEKLKEKERQEIEDLQKSHESNLKSAQEAHLAELEIVKRSHREEIKNLEDMQKKEKDATHTDKVPEKFDMQASLQTSLEDLKKLIKEEEEKYQALKDAVSKINAENEALEEEKEHVQSELTSENKSLLKTIEKKTAAQSDLEQLHDEAERIENDLDLLRNEKTVLITELQSLKESIKNQKTSSPSREKKENTAICKNIACQTFINHNSIACQISSIPASCVEASCQTADAICSTISSFSQTENSTKVDRSCQIGEVHRDEGSEKPRLTKSSSVESSTLEALVNKNLENALGDLKVGIEGRIKAMEEHLRTLQEKISEPIQQDRVDPDSEEYQSGNAINKGAFSSGAQDACTSHNAQFHKSDVHAKMSSHHNCNCGLGNNRSSDIMQDLRNSVHNLNHIVNRSFVPSSVNPYAMNIISHPYSSHTSSLDSFYRQYRDFQERKSASELNFKCQREILRNVRGSQSKDETHYANNAPGRKLTSSTSLSNPTLTTNTNSFQDDPITRARNIVLREQARVWKQQQLFTNPASYPHMLDESLPVPENYQLQSIYSSNVSAAFTVLPTFESSFPTYEQDTTSDYDTWMSRLKALQQRIRSHRLV